MEETSAITLLFNNTSLQLENNESILECLIRHDLTDDFMCKTGVCQSCLMRTDQTDLLNSKNQQALPDNLKKDGIFLGCHVHPHATIAVSPYVPEKKIIKAKVIDKEKLCRYVMALRIKPDSDISYKPGQHISIILKNKVTRTYAIANQLTNDGYIEIHIEKQKNGQFSTWAFDQAKTGDKVSLHSVGGFCHYDPAMKNQDILLFGTATGLSPLMGILHDAIQSNHHGKITLIHGTRNEESLYYQDKLNTLAKENKNFTYVPCILFNQSLNSSITCGSLYDIALDYFHNPINTRVFICGDKKMVKKMIQISFREGISPHNLYSDVFFHRTFAQLQTQK